MSTFEDITRCLEAGHAGSDFGMVGGLLGATPSGQVCAVLGIGPRLASVRLVLHPDDADRLVFTHLPDGRLALDITADHEVGATVVVETGCAWETTALRQALDDIVADIELVDTEFAPPPGGEVVSMAA